MDGEIVAEGLRFPEGPVWTGDALYVTEVEGGTIARWRAEDGTLERVATTGGGPNGAVLGADGALWVTQNGGMDPEHRITAGIQRVTAAGDVTMIASEVGDLPLGAPNDLAFGPDGRLWFTDPRGAPTNPLEPGRLFALDASMGTGQLVVEIDAVYPNGIAFAGDGLLMWTESFSRRVMALDAAGPRILAELPEPNYPDGMCVGADGTLYVASTYGHCVSVVRDGAVVDRLVCGDGMVTNCCFGGTDLYVTESRHGTVWRFPVGVEGLPLGQRQTL